MLRIFSHFDGAVPGESWLPLFTPFWGEHEVERGQKRPFEGRLTRYRKVAGELFLPTSPEEADVAVFPYGWESCGRPEGEAAMKAFTERARNAGIPVALFEHGDLNRPVPDGVRFSFHHSLHRSRRRPGAEVVPPLIADPLEEWGGEWKPRPFKSRPTASFRGVAPPIGLPFGTRRGKEVARLLGYRCGLLTARSSKVGYAPRAAAILALRRSEAVDFRGVVLGQSPVQWRCGYMVGGSGAMEPEASRRTYLDELAASDYVLCARGQGNYSLRFFETLAFGRIPVVVDTDVVLPFEDEIDWRSLLVRIPKRREREIGDRIAGFHHRLGADDFAKRQEELRALFVRWMEPAGFFREWGRRMEERLCQSRS